jgi:hypothetical protein
LAIVNLTSLDANTEVQIGLTCEPESRRATLISSTPQLRYGVRSRRQVLHSALTGLPNEA